MKVLKLPVPLDTPSEWRPSFRAIAHLGFARVLRAMRATEEFAVSFHAVTDDLAVTVAAFRRERVNGALETVEHMGCVVLNDLERLVVVVAADFARGHITLLLIHPAGYERSASACIGQRPTSR
jgi:hypothetical protein